MNNYVWRIEQERKQDNDSVLELALKMLNGKANILSENVKVGSRIEQYQQKQYRVWCDKCKGSLSEWNKHLAPVKRELDSTSDHKEYCRIETREITKRRHVKGRSVNFSIAKTCSPTAQCVSCYASDPKAQITWNKALLRQSAVTLACNLDYRAFAIQLAKECARSLKYLDFGTHYSLRWFGSGDLTPASINAIVYWLQLLNGSKAFIATVFTRKPYQANRLIAKARDAGVDHLLSVNFSLDSSDYYESLNRMNQLGDNVYNVRLVQYVREGDKTFPFSDVVFPDHHDKQSIHTNSNDCPAIRERYIGCRDCKRCFQTTGGRSDSTERIVRTNRSIILCGK